ncbi:MAG TPA: YdcF family protein [Polyangiaceae bacterium]|nr:YdcF family protein [Polyangiaceae bacterium]
MSLARLAIASLLGCACSDATTNAPDASDAAALPEVDTTACPPLGDDETPMTFSRSYTPLSSGSYVQDKGFYLVTILEGTNVWADLASDPTLAAAASSRDAALRSAATSCAGDATCVTNAIAFSASDADAIAQALAARLGAAGDVSKVATDHMRPSGAFNVSASLDDASLIAQAWRDTAASLTNGVAAYAPEIAGAALASAISSVVAAHSDPMPFWLPATATLLAILDADQRDDAALGEPIDQGENAAALSHVPSIDFSKYAYTMLVVPGIGPTDATTELSFGSQQHADLAADRFAAGWAPLFALTGGRVHPDRTTYAEALEMKKYLMTMRGIPENVILVDPYARHTTTNIRNVSRLAFRYGVPTNVRALIVTNLTQTLTITGAPFLDTCQNEMGLVPWRSVAQLSDEDTCFVPSVIVMQQHGADALDP